MWSGMRLFLGMNGWDGMGWDLGWIEGEGLLH
jgi:hypothetical protein